MLKAINNNFFLKKFLFLYLQYDYKIFINLNLKQNLKKFTNFKKLKISLKIIKKFSNDSFFYCLKNNVWILFLNNENELNKLLNNLSHYFFCYKNQFLNHCDFLNLCALYTKNYNEIILFYYHFLIFNNLIFFYFFFFIIWLKKKIIS
jgi:hypothetical protein